jgi:[acyl-carrier-protein] S-malonyltransferase
MLDGVKGHAAFADRYRLVCDALGADPLAEIARDPSYVNRNRVSSLLTVLASSLSLDLYSGPPAKALAGYSVGQWTALYAAGALSFEELVQLVARRAQLMDECFAETPGAMMAVIGVARAKVEEFAREAEIVITNYNCAGQYTLGGTVAAIDAAMESVNKLEPLKVVRLSVSGAWHSPLLLRAAERFREQVGPFCSRPRKIPVADNASGGWLPDDPRLLEDRLCEHLCSPVRWDENIKALVAAGCNELVEIGFGSVLSRFGPFIDRSVKHRAFYASPA